MGESFKIVEVFPQVAFNGIPSTEDTNGQGISQVVDLAEFFKESQWQVARILFGGKEWFTWQKYIGQNPVGPNIYLAEYDAKNPPVIIKPAPIWNTSILWIPAPKLKNPATVEIDKEYNVVQDSPLKTGGECSFPIYLAVAQRVPHVIENIRYEGNEYTLIPIGGGIGGVVNEGIYAAVDVRCINPPLPEEKKEEKRMPVIPPAADIYRPEKVVNLDICAVYDTSKSMRRLSGTAIHEPMAENLRRYMNERSAEYERLGYLVSFSLTLYLVSKDNVVRKTHKDIGDWQINSAWLQSRYDGLVKLSPRPLFTTTDAQLLPQNNLCGAGEIWAGDNYASAIPMPPVVEYRLRNTSLMSIADGNDYDALIERAIKNGQPLFIAQYLADGGEGTPSDISSGKSDFDEKKRAIASLAWQAMNGDAVAKERLWKIFRESSKAPSDNFKVQSRTSHELNALLNPFYQLQDAFSGFSGENLGVRTYLARAVSSVIDPVMAQELLKDIKTNPAASANTLYLIALSGSDKFAETLSFMLDHVWGKSIVDNDLKGRLGLALAVIFSDPMVVLPQMAKIKKERPELVKMLSGARFDADSIQRSFELISDWVIPSLSADVSSVAALMQAYALMYLNPPWVKKDKIALNTIPRERYYYDIPEAGALFQLNNIVKTAKYEDAWIGLKDTLSFNLFEIGLLVTAHSANVAIDWPFIEATAGKGVLKVAHIHLHPWADTSMPSTVSKLPSEADFRAWLSFIAEVRRKYPDAIIELEIISPLGPTKITPTQELISIAEKGEHSEQFEAAIASYKEYVDSHWGLFNIRDINEIIGRFYVIKL